MTSLVAAHRGLNEVERMQRFRQLKVILALQRTQ
jgi:hypothetical protein